MYINTTSLTQHSESEIRSLNPNTSFGNPFVPPDEYAFVFPAPQPALTDLQSARETVPLLTAKGHWEQQWDVVDTYADYTDADGVLHTKAEQEAASLAAKLAQQQASDRATAKAARTAAVAAIKVTTSAGNTFDGDETSQGRMARAVIALSTGLAPSVTWVLADNTTIQATAAELTEALVLAGQAQSAIWVI